MFKHRLILFLVLTSIFFTGCLSTAKSEQQEPAESSSFGTEDFDTGGIIQADISDPQEVISSFEQGDTGPGGGVIIFSDGSCALEAVLLPGTYSFEEAGAAADGWTGNGCDDWRASTKGEMEMIYARMLEGSMEDWPRERYWSGSLDGAPGSPYAWFLETDNGIIYHNSSRGLEGSYRTAAVRAFQFDPEEPEWLALRVTEDGIVMEVSHLLGHANWEDAQAIVAAYRGGGYDDWRLPTVEELLLLYRTGYQSGRGGFAADRIWSGTPSIENNAYFVDFANGSRYANGNGEAQSLRPFRAVRRSDGSEGFAVLQQGILRIDPGAARTRSGFARRNDIREIRFPDSLRAIGPGAFRENDALESLVIPGTVEEIGTWSFGMCPQLNSVSLEEGVRTIEYRAFFGCANIRFAELPASLTEIGNEAFHRNTTLIVKPGSHAHQWAEENRYTYQFMDSDSPEGVRTIVEPLLRTGWKQSGKYRRYIPADRSVGCWSVALGQIMFHHRLHPTGRKAYESDAAVINIDYDRDRVDLSQISPYLTRSSTEDEIDATATYLFYVATVFENKFNGSTGVSGLPYHERMEQHFAVDMNRYHYSRDTSREALERLIEENLRAGWPLMLYLEGNGTGHACVIDGFRYRREAMEVHINFGWAWEHDGWFLLWEPINTRMVNLDAPLRLVYSVQPLD